MKQKLLNSFTWRGTLLVALLSCAFSAWGEEPITLTFNAQSGGLSQDSNDAVTWELTDGSPSFDDNMLSSQSNFTLTSSSITGKIKNITINAYGDDQKATVTVTCGGTKLIDNKPLPKNSGNVQYNPTNQQGQSVPTYQTGQIVVTINKGGNKKSHHLESIVITYVVPDNSTFTISENCYGLDGDGNEMKFGTYSNTCQFVLPTGVTASKISVENGKLKLASLSGIIPANTGILVSSSSAVNSTVDFRLATATNVSGNMLQPSSAMPLPANAPANTKYYCLRMDGTDIGFYYGADGGGVFEMPDNKAFLAVTTTTAEPEANVQSFSFSDMVNGINAVETEKAESKVIYNLAGQRVSKMQKGIYVVNGKKMLVK